MREAAGNLEFEEAARLRDEIRRLEASELGVKLAPTARDPARAESQRLRTEQTAAAPSASPAPAASAPRRAGVELGSPATAHGAPADVAQSAFCRDPGGSQRRLPRGAAHPGAIVAGPVGQACPSSLRTIFAPSASALSFIRATMRESGFIPQSVVR